MKPCKQSISERNIRPLESLIAEAVEKKVRRTQRGEQLKNRIADSGLRGFLELLAELVADKVLEGLLKERAARQRTQK